MTARKDQQATALVALLKALPEKQLLDVLQGVGASLDVEAGPRHRGKPCAVCGLIYPQHVARWGNEDHAFETKVSRRG